MEQQTLNGTAQTAAQNNPYAKNNPYARPDPTVPAPKKSGRTGLRILAVLMCLLLVCSTALSALSVALQVGGDLEWVIDDLFSSRDVSRENNVEIGGEYMIRSTEQISDAYLSGDASGLSDRDKETLKMASDILDEIITDGMEDVEKEAAVYEWLTRKLQSENGMLTVIPTTSEECDNPFGVLKYRSAVCVGYATTFRLFMHMLGIPCMVVHDSYRSHSWDLVQLDGEWYHTDCYFDSPEGNYRHFNMNDAVREQDEDWNTDFFPAATGTKYNYAVYNCKDLKDIYALPAFVKAGLDDGKTMLSCRFETPVDENEQAATYMVQAVSAALGMTEAYGAYYMDDYWMQDADGDYVLCLFFTDYSDTPADLPDEALEKIENAVNDAFDVAVDMNDLSPDGNDWGDEDVSWWSDVDGVVTHFFGG